jgi:hypothetical protein
MRESVTYQAILAEGKAEGKAEGRAEGKAEGAIEEVRKVLLGQGEVLFGEPPPAWAIAALARIDDLKKLETLAKLVLRVRSWDELLPHEGTPARRKKGRSSPG